MRQVLRLKEKLYEKEVELEEAKDALIDRQHAQSIQDIVLLASPTISQRQMAGYTPKAVVRKENVLAAEVANMKNALTRAEADNQFLSNTVKAAVRQKGNIPDSMYAEAMRICDRLCVNKTNLLRNSSYS